MHGDIRTILPINQYYKHVPEHEIFLDAVLGRAHSIFCLGLHWSDHIDG